MPGALIIHRAMHLLYLHRSCDDDRFIKSHHSIHSLVALDEMVLDRSFAVNRLIRPTFWDDRTKTKEYKIHI